MIDLTFLKEDPDNCRIYYRADNKDLYCTVDGKLHACTLQGEPEYPVNTNNFNIWTLEKSKFIQYVIDYYWEMDKEVLTKHQVRIALGKRLLSKDTNEHGKVIGDIPFCGDSFDRQYVRMYIE